MHSARAMKTLELQASPGLDGPTGADGGGGGAARTTCSEGGGGGGSGTGCGRVTGASTGLEAGLRGASGVPGCTGLSQPDADAGVEAAGDGVDGRNSSMGSGALRGVEAAGAGVAAAVTVAAGPGLGWTQK